MKKFSKITGEKIGQEPKSGEVKKLNEEEAFRGRVMTLSELLLMAQLVDIKVLAQ